MKVLIFIGPTLPSERVHRLLPGAVVRGPAECGDVYRAARAGFEVVGLCDGYFEHRLPVWHKELLWALKRGVRLYGAASMGALRAAELAPFGMVGVGQVFEWFRDGLLMDDDEVAVAHEPAERGYRPVSEAMVNMRATFQRALECGIIGVELRDQLVLQAKRIFYAQRSYGALWAAMAAAGQEDRALAPLRQWISEHGSINQKLRDACTMLELIGQARPVTLADSVPGFHFEYTDAWHAFCQRMTERRTLQDHRGRKAEAGDVAPAPLEPQSEAFARALALQLAEADGAIPTPEQVQTQSDALRQRLNLLTPEATVDWLVANGLDLADFSLLAYKEWLVERYLERARRLAVAQAKAVAALGRAWRR